MNIGRIILRNQIEELLNVAVFSVPVDEFEFRRSPVGLPRSLEVAADLAGLSESLIMRIEQQESLGDGSPDRR